MRISDWSSDVCSSDLAADDRRPIVIHSQFQRRDQLADYKRIGVSPAYFPNHAWYWADVHRTNFPDEVVDFISPFRSARAAGLIPSTHSDFSVTPLDTRFMLWTSMARVSIGRDSRRERVCQYL